MASELAGVPAWLVSLLNKLRGLREIDGKTFAKRAAVAAVVGGGGYVAARYIIDNYLFSKAPIEEEKKVSERKEAEEKDSKKSSSRVAVDSVFFARLRKIIGIMIPSVFTSEFAFLAALTGLLFARTWFSIWIAEILGRNAQALVSRNWGEMYKGIKSFAMITIPAAAVNSGIRYCSQMLSLKFQVRLSHHVHQQYLLGVNFYKAHNFGGIDHCDQRVTADIDHFCYEICQLYTSVFKPILDVVLFTYKLGDILGWQGPLAMHTYFIISGFLKRAIQPSIGQMVADESALEGQYRTAHQRLITNSEEIAFYDGSHRERGIINGLLHRLYTHASKLRYTRAWVNVFDGLLVKYYATIAGYVVLLSPLLLDLVNSRGKNPEELTRDYIRNNQYLSNLSSAVSDLLLTGNKLTTIAGYTSRVAQLLEKVQQLSDTGNTPFAIKDDDTRRSRSKRAAAAAAAAASTASTDVSSVAAASSSSSPVPPPLIAVPSLVRVESRVFNETGEAAWIASWGLRCEDTRELRLHLHSSEQTRSPVIGGGKLIEGDSIVFEHVDIVSPDGKLLVKDLNFRVDPGVNVMVTGPNGVGKSSLFRIIGELWPLHSGTLTKPRCDEVLFVPQKPYLVLGTLRDQIIYPHSKEDMKAIGVTDEDLRKLLAIVDPVENILNEWSFDTEKDWFQTFSGGQKQRVGMARLFYHRPKFAILDECTSAVSDEIEDKIYETCHRLGITIFTVSHRASLARHHHKILRFKGSGRWEEMPVLPRGNSARSLPKLVDAPG